MLQARDHMSCCRYLPRLRTTNFGLLALWKVTRHRFASGILSYVSYVLAVALYEDPKMGGLESYCPISEICRATDLSPNIFSMRDKSNAYLRSYTYN